jgi:hypothetical protein
MTQALIGTQNLPFSHESFPITPDTMGDFSELPREMFLEIFKYLNNKDLERSALVNWTCKEVIERNTDWGERKRFFRILPSLFKLGKFEEKTKLSDSIDSEYILNFLEQSLTDTNRPTQELSQILNLYPNPRIWDT